MRFSLPFYFGSVPPAELSAAPQFGFSISATLSVEGGPLFIADYEDLSPLVMEAADMDPLETFVIDISPLVMEE